MAVRITESGARRITESGAVRVTESHIIAGTFWLPSLPQYFLLDTYRSTRPQTLLRSQPEAGPAILRRRFTAAVMPFGGAMVMSKAQRDAFVDFYEDTLIGGSAMFQFPAQDGSSAVWDCRFTAEPEEEWISDTHWRIVMQMERLP